MLPTTQRNLLHRAKQNIPFVVPNEFENGPDNYGINAKAEITVTMASELGVKASHAAGAATDLDVASVLRIKEDPELVC